MIKMYPENSGRLQGHHIRQYLYGGKGIVTLQSPSGIHHTYMFARPQEFEAFPDDVIFIYAVHSEKNSHKLFYVGMIENDVFRLTRHSRFGPHTEIVRGAKYIMKMMHNPNLNTPMKLYHQGTCGVCGRALTSLTSIRCGVGPKCRKRVNE